ncbi:hypothetical protein ACJJTC_017101 [Scirpophaga incertulas]
MYAEWSTLPLEGGGRGVLGVVGGKDVVLAVVKQLESHEPSPLTTDAEVEWVLEVIRYGLSLPLAEHEAVRACVRVCCAWLGALLPPAAAAPHPPPPAVPAPVRARPKHYAAPLLRHLLNLFVPRPDETLSFVFQTELGGDLISKQAVLCHRVLRLARELAANADLGEREWRALLLLLLGAGDALLAPPAPHRAAAERLAERVLCVLAELWLLACHRCFPSPPLWRTLREQCLRWRHRAPLTDQWVRASLCLTARLLRHLYGPHFPAPVLGEEDANLVPADMSAEAVVQSWYRMLHTIGNPVDLCRPHLVSQTPEFLQYSYTAEDNKPHPCLAALPAIFHRAMRGLAAHVDAFLGLGTDRWWGGEAAEPPEPEEADTPPPHRRLAKSFSVTARPRDRPDRGMPRTSLIGLTSSRPPSVVPTTPPNSITSQVCELESPPLTPLRPKVNSIFHLFGEWLFEAALIGTTPPPSCQQRADGTPPPPSMSDATYKLNMLSYQPGRAEALGAVCRVLCSKQCGEAVLAPYLARCYAALRGGLRGTGAAAAAVLRYAPDLLRLDLDGALVLVQRATWRRWSASCPSATTAAWTWGGSGAGGAGGARRLSSESALVASRATANAAKKERCLRLGGPTALCLVSGGPPLRGACSSRFSYCRRPPTDFSNAGATDYKARSDSGGAAGGADGHSLDDYAADVRELDPSSPLFGAALVVRATYLVCHRLISSWKGDLQVSLAALELLSGLAKLHSSKSEAVERKRAVRWICDYIVVQCSRPPPAHSRDLHSCVVAAYHCLCAWLCPALLRDRAARAALLPVLELGLSGARSGKPGEPPKMKDEKELKPVSMRVRDAAESLLMLILDQVGVDIGSEGCGAARWCRLDERWLRALGHGRPRHFVADGSALLTLLEEPLANSQEPQPTLQVIIRCGWGRFAWSLSCRGAARSGARGLGGACPRPVDMQPAPRPPPPACRPPPPAPPAAVDSAFPSLDSVLRQLNDPDAHTLFKLLEQQAVIEKRVAENADHTVPEEYAPPEPVTEFQTARLFLSHFGYLNIGGDKKGGGGGGRLVALDSAAPGFEAALRRVDACGWRAPLTVHVFCARAGQRRAADIVRNARLPRPRAACCACCAGMLHTPALSDRHRAQRAPAAPAARPAAPVARVCSTLLRSQTDIVRNARLPRPPRVLLRLLRGYAPHSCALRPTSCATRACRARRASCCACCAGMLHTPALSDRHRAQRAPAAPAARPAAPVARVCSTLLRSQTDIVRNARLPRPPRGLLRLLRGYAPHSCALRPTSCATRACRARRASCCACCAETIRVALCRSLGTPVRVRGHGGWAGRVERSYDAAPPALQPLGHEHAHAHDAAAGARDADAPTPALYDGREQVPHTEHALAVESLRATKWLVLFGFCDIDGVLYTEAKKEANRLHMLLPLFAERSPRVMEEG